MSLKATSVVTGLGLEERGNSVSALKLLKISQIPERIIGAYKSWFNYYISVKTNWISTEMLTAVNIMLIAGIVFVVVYMMRQEKHSPLYAMLTFAMVLMLPLGMNSIYVISVGEYHDLMKYGCIFTYIAALVLIEKSRIKFTKVLGTISIVIIIFCGIQTANLAYLKKNLVYQSTYAHMCVVLDDMLDFGYKPGECQAYVIGKIDTSDYAQMGGIDNITGMYTDNAVTADVKSIDYYFNYVLGLPIEMCSKEIQEEILATDEYKKMSTFPEDGYIGYIKDVLVVKLSELE